MKTESSDIQTALKYYSILDAINSLGLSRRELELLAFMRVEGSISNKGAKEKFARLFNSSKPTAANTTTLLSRKGLIFDRNGKKELHPQLLTDTSDGIIMEVIIRNGEDKRSVDREDI